MFGSVGKGGLVKRLWSLQASQSGEDDGWSAEAYKAFKSLVKSRDSKELKNFVETMKSGGSEDSECWMLSQRLVEIQGAKVPAQLVCCRLFRWPDVRNVEQIQRLAPCACNSSRQDGPTTCCNPFHFGRLLTADLPPIDVDRTVRSKTTHHRVEEGSTNDSAFFDGSMSDGSDLGFSELSVSDQCVDLPSVDGATSSGRRVDSEVRSRPVADGGGSWLSIAYWELNVRLGRQYRVSQPTTTVSYSCEGDNTFCIRKLKNKDRSEAVERKRALFGRGFALWKDDDGVWLYNKSEHGVFVQSPTLSMPYGAKQVYKILPGQMMKIFDRERAELLELYLKQHGGIRFPLDVFSLRISLVSGWGEGYSRQNVMQCPCWLELFLSFP